MMSTHNTRHDRAASSMVRTWVRPAWIRAIATAGEESGQAIVEFALILGLLLLVVFGITQFGLAFNTANDETHLANEAARYAAVNYNPAPGGASLLSWIKSQADTTFLSSGGTVCLSFPNGTPVQV